MRHSEAARAKGVPSWWAKVTNRVRRQTGNGLTREGGSSMRDQDWYKKITVTSVRYNSDVEGVLGDPAWFANSPMLAMLVGAAPLLNKTP